MHCPGPGWSGRFRCHRTDATRVAIVALGAGGARPAAGGAPHPTRFSTFLLLVSLLFHFAPVLILLLLHLAAAAVGVLINS